VVQSVEAHITIKIFNPARLQKNLPTPVLGYAVETKGATEVRIKTILDRKTLPKTCIPESKLVVVANGSG